jgi:hypothetical protein
MYVLNSGFCAPKVEGVLPHIAIVDVSYAAPQAHGIVNVSLHRKFFHVSYLYFHKGEMISIMSKTKIWSNSNEYY